MNKLAIFLNSRAHYIAIANQQSNATFSISLFEVGWLAVNRKTYAVHYSMGFLSIVL